MFKNTKKLLDVSMNMGTPAAEVLIFHNGKEVFSERRGYFDEEGTALSGDELYNIYSCSKFITCAAALKLFERGAYRLEDDLADYIPAFGDMTVKKDGGIFKAERRIKISQLFDMTAGLNYNCESEEMKQGIKETGGVCGTLKMMDYVAIMQENEALKTIYENKLLEIDELKYYINAPIDDEYKEKMARLLGYCFPDEIIYFVE